MLQKTVLASSHTCEQFDLNELDDLQLLSLLPRFFFFSEILCPQPSILEGLMEDW